jgi:alginate O-acetyltransferase complex protein AlgI
VVVADNLSVYVKYVYNNQDVFTNTHVPPQTFSGPVLALATVCFAFQVYCDFSGYSDIAIGAARVMGFTLMKNFDMPFHSQTIVELWRRWHISLTTWFRDYLFLPIGRKRVPLFLSLMIVYMVCGLWHGANWTFLLFGAIHGLFIIIGSLTSQRRLRLARATGWSNFPQLVACTKILITFSLFCITLVIFRARSVTEAMLIFAAIPFGWTALLHHPMSTLFVTYWHPLAVGLAGALVVELVHVMQKRGPISERLARQPWWSRWALYYAITAILFFLYEPGGDKFIYFQF